MNNVSSRVMSQAMNDERIHLFSSLPMRVARILCLPILAAAVTACNGLLDVSDPTKIQAGDIANSAGASGLYATAMMNFQNGLISAASVSSLFADERTYEIPSVPNPAYSDRDIDFDRRDGGAYETNATTNGFSDPFLADLDQAIGPISVAIRAMRLYGDSATKDNFLGELFAARGTIILQIAQDVCSGFPINDIDDRNLPVYSLPYTTDSAAAYAVTQLDSALAHATSDQLVNFARVVKGRALLELGQWSAAAAAVQAVPDDFVYATYSDVGNPFWSYDITGGGRPVSDTEGINGLPFVSAHDPRVLTEYKAQRFLQPDDSLYDQAKYSSYSDPMPIATGVEARLIQAEAALHTATADSTVSILNALRATVPGLDPLETQSTLDDQVNQVYYERAFWLWLTGRRLSDLRRLVRLYNRTPDSVYPKGAYWIGGTYGTSTAIPFVLATNKQFNAHITSGCITP